MAAFIWDHDLYEVLDLTFITDTSSVAWEKRRSK